MGGTAEKEREGGREEKSEGEEVGCDRGAGIVEVGKALGWIGWWSRVGPRVSISVR